jgi:hypothetical protein
MEFLRWFSLRVGFWYCIAEDLAGIQLNDGAGLKIELLRLGWAWPQTLGTCRMEMVQNGK